LSGYRDDGTAGLYAVKACGGATRIGGAAQAAPLRDGDENLRCDDTIHGEDFSCLSI
jgi:hypothetical protein